MALYRLGFLLSFCLMRISIILYRTCMWCFLIFTFTDTQALRSKNVKTSIHCYSWLKPSKLFLFSKFKNFNNTQKNQTTLKLKIQHFLILSSFCIQLLWAKNEFYLPKAKTSSQFSTTLHKKQQSQKQNSISVGSCHQDIVAHSSLLKKYSIISNGGKICLVPRLHELQCNWDRGFTVFSLCLCWLPCNCELFTKIDTTI